MQEAITACRGPASPQSSSWLLSSSYHVLSSPCVFSEDMKDHDSCFISLVWSSLSIFATTVKITSHFTTTFCRKEEITNAAIHFSGSCVCLIRGRVIAQPDVAFVIRLNTQCRHRLDNHVVGVETLDIGVRSMFLWWIFLILPNISSSRNRKRHRPLAKTLPFN